MAHSFYYWYKNIVFRWEYVDWEEMGFVQISINEDVWNRLKENESDGYLDERFFEEWEDYEPGEEQSIGVDDYVRFLKWALEEEEKVEFEVFSEHPFWTFHDLMHAEYDWDYFSNNQTINTRTETEKHVKALEYIHENNISLPWMRMFVAEELLIRYNQELRPRTKWTYEREPYFLTPEMIEPYYELDDETLEMYEFASFEF
jgi:hypothetical protein